MAYPMSGFCRQYADQRSTGANLLTGSYYQTDQFGARLQAGHETGIFTAAYTVVDPNFSMQTPWSANPFYIDAHILAFDRAGENATLLGASYDFTPVGLRGVAAQMQYFRGWTGAPAAGARRWSKTSGTSIWNGAPTSSRSAASGLGPATDMPPPTRAAPSRPSTKCG